MILYEWEYLTPRSAKIRDNSCLGIFVGKVTIFNLKAISENSNQLAHVYYKVGLSLYGGGAPPCRYQERRGCGLSGLGRIRRLGFIYCLNRSPAANNIFHWQLSFSFNVSGIIKADLLKYQTQATPPYGCAIICTAFSGELSVGCSSYPPICCHRKCKKKQSCIVCGRGR